LKNGKVKDKKFKVWEFTDWKFKEQQAHQAVRPILRSIICVPAEGHH